MAIINLLVEGDVDEAVAIRLVTETGHIAGVCHGKRGSGYIQSKIKSFNLTAQTIYYLALVDFMDTQMSCPAEVIANWLSHRQPKMVFRIVVREVESWLLADRKNLARFLTVAPALVPVNPEQVADPKLSLVNVARHSKNAQIRSALVPEVGSTAQVGKLYTSTMKYFIAKLWDVQAARNNAPSLERCLRRLEELS